MNAARPASAARRPGQADAKPAPRRDLGVAQFRLRGIDFGQDVEAVLEEQASFPGERHIARFPVVRGVAAIVFQTA